MIDASGWFVEWSDGAIEPVICWYDDGDAVVGMLARDDSTRLITAYDAAGGGVSFVRYVNVIDLGEDDEGDDDVGVLLVER